jgi:DNA-binding PadR family transcriptional regulator
MFGKRFEFEGPDEGFPPWEQGAGPHFHAMRFERGPFRPGPPSGHGGPFGPGEGARVFGRGDMKFALLGLLQERPMHGYEMIKALEERSGGFYSPSPGSIYPTLQMLEDRGCVTVQEIEGKKVYSITDAGKALLDEHNQSHAEFGPPWARMRERGRRGPSPELQALLSESREVMRLFAIAGRMSFQDAQQIAKLRTVLERTRKELTDLIYGASSQQEPGGQNSPE